MGFKPESDVPILQMGGVPRSWPACSRSGSSAVRFRCRLSTRQTEGYRELADVADLVPDYQVAGIVTRRSFIKQNGDAVRGFIKAIIEAAATFKNDPATARKVMRERLKIDDPSVIEETQKNYPRYMPMVPYRAAPDRRHQVVPG